MSMLLRRQMMRKSGGGGGGDGLVQVTINSEPTNPNDCWAALKQAANLPDGNFIAFVDDYSYMTSGGDKCMCVVNAHNSANDSVVYRNDSGTYGYMRYFAASGTSSNVVIPSGTVFNVFVYPDS